MKPSLIFYSTYARTIVSELVVLAALIQKYSSTKPPEATPGLNFPNSLTLKQIEDSLSNPQNSIKPSVATYATIIKLRREVNIIQERNRAQRGLLQKGIAKLREKMSAATSEAQKSDIMEAIEKMEKSYKNLGSALKHVSSLEKQIKAFEIKLINLIKKYDVEWENYREHFLYRLSEEVEKIGIELSELEKKDLLIVETWAEILLRFQTLNLEIPNYLNIAEPKMTTYFKMKAYLAIHASLSRRMLPNKPENIFKFLKKLPK